MHHMLNITILVTSDDPAFLLLCLTLLDYGGNLANPGVDYFKMIFWAVIRMSSGWATHYHTNYRGVVHYWSNGGGCWRKIRKWNILPQAKINNYCPLRYELWYLSFYATFNIIAKILSITWFLLQVICNIELAALPSVRLQPTSRHHYTYYWNHGSMSGHLKTLYFTEQYLIYVCSYFFELSGKIPKCQARDQWIAKTSL